MKQLYIACSLLLTTLLAACGSESEPAASADEASASVAAASESAPVVSSDATEELAAETMGIIEQLPEQYPPHWILVQDGSFFNMLDGKLMVVDAASDNVTDRYKGMINSAFLANTAQARTRPELYVVETFMERGTRGKRSDVFSIYSKQDLALIGEIDVPAKRSSNMPTIFNLALVDNEKLALVYNFTPAASVTVVDLDAREFVGEIPIPGCALAYPMAGRGFSSICADGSLYSVAIGADPGDIETARTAAFFDYENDPLMEKAAPVGSTTYFPSFLGNMYPVDMSGRVAVPGEPWSLLGDDDEGWRPGGLQLSAVDSSGRIYLLMHPDGYDGSHKDPGVEVWVYDPATEQRVDRIALDTPLISINVTRDDQPLLVGTNINLAIDVYDVGSGDYQRTLNDIGSQTPFMLYGAH